MTIDDYLAGIERGLAQNVHIGKIESDYLFPSTTAISCSLNPYKSYTSLSISRSVASI